MRKFICALACCVFIFSCKKDGLSKLKSEFAGTWELHKSIGYPFINPVYPPGNGSIIFLDDNGSVELRRHDTVERKSRYFLQEKKDCYEEKKKVYLTTTDQSYPHDWYITLDSGMLVLSTPNCYADGGLTYYRRIQ